MVFKDPGLQFLSARIQMTILSVSMYDRVFRRWKEFTLSQGKLPRLPTAAREANSSEEQAVQELRGQGWLCQRPYHF